MVIRKKRIRNLNSNLSFVEPSEVITPSTCVTDAVRSKLASLGFEELTPGTTVLPRIVGPVSRFNAEGKTKLLRHLPKEEMVRERDWTWTEFHGTERVEREKTVYISYWRFQRELIPPPSVELTLAKDGEGQLYVTARTNAFVPDNETALLHDINLMLELFGECEIRRANLTAFVVSPIKRFNWEILPPGELPWSRVKEAVASTVERSPKGNRPAIWRRFETLNERKPDFHAVGQAGFAGYVVFGFRKLNLYVVESKNYGNATYVFESDWETLSQMTKAEILNENGVWLESVRKVR